MQKQKNIQHRKSSWKELILSGVLLFSFLSVGIKEVAANNVYESGHFSDPLDSNVQCVANNDQVLKITGGSGYYEWNFTGNGVDGVFGSLTDGETVIDDSDQILITQETQVTYVAPAVDSLSKLGSVQIVVRDRYYEDDDGKPQSKTFTINLRPSCVKNIMFIDPEAGETYPVRKGIPMALSTISAILENGQQFIYDLPHLRIDLATKPTDAGYFEGKKYFYTTESAGYGSLYAYIDQEDAATNSGSWVYTDPLSLAFAEQACSLSETLYQGLGGGFDSSTYVNSKEPWPLAARIKTGENKVIFVEDGNDQYIFTSSDPSVIAVQTLSELNSSLSGSSSNEESDEDYQTPTVTDYAVLTGVGSGVATVFVTDKSGCTAILTIYVDNFVPEIEYAKFVGNAGIAKGARETLYLKVSDLDTIDDLFEIETQLIKGEYDSVDDIPATAQTFDIADEDNSIESEATQSGTEETSDGETQSVYTRLFKIPIFIPEYSELTDGTYTLLVTITDTRMESSNGANQIQTVLSLEVGDTVSISGDITGDGTVDMIDAIQALRIFSKQTTSQTEVSLLDIITILRTVTQSN